MQTVLCPQLLASVFLMIWWLVLFFPWYIRILNVLFVLRRPWWVNRMLKIQELAEWLPPPRHHPTPAWPLLTTLPCPDFFSPFVCWWDTKKIWQYSVLDTPYLTDSSCHPDKVCHVPFLYLSSVEILIGWYHTKHMVCVRSVPQGNTSSAVQRITSCLCGRPTTSLSSSRRPDETAMTTGKPSKVWTRVSDHINMFFCCSVLVSWWWSSSFLFFHFVFLSVFLLLCMLLIVYLFVEVWQACPVDSCLLPFWSQFICFSFYALRPLEVLGCVLDM